MTIRSLIRTDNKKIFLSLIMSLVSTIALSIRVSSDTVGLIFCEYSFLPFLCFTLLLLVYLQILKAEIKSSIYQKVIIIISSVLFALFMLIGGCFEATESLAPLHGPSNVVLSCLFLAGYTLLFYNLISLLFSKLDGIALSAAESQESRKSPARGYMKLLSEHPALTVFVTILISTIPYIILSYPGIFLGDEVVQIAQWYEEDYPLNNFFPIFHTLILNVFLSLGLKLFHSANIGIFLYSISQLLIMIWAVAYFCSYLIKKVGLNPGWVLAAEIYYLINPRFHNYLMVVTKDVYYAVALLLFICFLHSLFTGNRSAKTILFASLSGLGILLLRNEGRYVLLFSFLMMLLFCGKSLRKLSLIALVSTVIVSFILSNVIFPAFNVEPGNKREMFSVPFQQTARYVRDRGSNVTEEEKASISAVLSYDKLAKNYDPNRSDDVKKTFKKNCTDEELKSYFSTWFSMLKKEPVIYLEAFINNYYQYIYPGEVLMKRRGYGYSENCFEIDSERFERYHIDLRYPERFDRWRSAYQSLCERVETIPIMSFLVSAATYGWTLLLMIFWTIYRKCGPAFALLMPSLGVFLMCFLGPCNGFFCRYTYPLIIVLPAFVILSIQLTNNKGKDF